MALNKPRTPKKTSYLSIARNETMRLEFLNYTYPYLQIFSKPPVLHQNPWKRSCSIHLLMRNPGLKPVNKEYYINLTYFCHYSFRYVI